MFYRRIGRNWPAAVWENLLFAAALFFCYFPGMDQEMILFQQNARLLDIELNNQQLAQFDAYQRELLKWNARANLISQKSSQEIITRHFLDSLTALKFIDQQDARIVDLGCGAGLPGIPLKIAAPGLRLYLMETNRKKVSFLKNVLRLLALPDTFILHERAENLLKNSQWNNFFDIVISRAAFKLPALLHFGTYFLAPGGKLIALKSSSIGAEFSQAAAVTACYGFNQLFQYDINEDFLGIPRKIIVVEKTKLDKKPF